ncbi:MAG: hypothetical protein LWW81_16830, partial [Rhodocyclales bacterium]|nr:hypothetical protein [Rhodocyclales bacterium]
TKRARLFFAYFILAKQKKVSRRSTAKPSASYEENPFGVGNQRARFAAWQPVGSSETQGFTANRRAGFADAPFPVAEQPFSFQKTSVSAPIGQRRNPC